MATAICLECHGYATVITVNEPRPINSVPLFALAGGGVPFAAHERLVKRSVRLQRFITRSRGLHGLGNKVSLGTKTLPSSWILQRGPAPPIVDNLLHTLCRFESDPQAINFSHISVIPTGNVTQVILLSLSF